MLYNVYINSDIDEDGSPARSTSVLETHDEEFALKTAIATWQGLVARWGGDIHNFARRNQVVLLEDGDLDILEVIGADFVPTQASRT